MNEQTQYFHIKVFFREMGKLSEPVHTSGLVGMPPTPTISSMKKKHEKYTTHYFLSIYFNPSIQRTGANFGNNQ